MRDRTSKPRHQHGLGCWRIHCNSRRRATVTALFGLMLEIWWCRCFGYFWWRPVEVASDDGNGGNDEAHVKQVSVFIWGGYLSRAITLWWCQGSRPEIHHINTAKEYRARQNLAFSSVLVPCISHQNGSVVSAVLLLFLFRLLLQMLWQSSSHLLSKTKAAEIAVSVVTIIIIAIIIIVFDRNRCRGLFLSLSLLLLSMVLLLAPTRPWFWNQNTAMFSQQRKCSSQTTRWLAVWF